MNGWTNGRAGGQTEGSNRSLLVPFTPGTDLLIRKPMRAGKILSGQKGFLLLQGTWVEIPATHSAVHKLL